MIKNLVPLFFCISMPFFMTANTGIKQDSVIGNLQDTMPVRGMIVDTSAAAAIAADESSIPTITLDDVDDASANPNSDQNISSALTAGRDPFYSAATFSFGVARFKIRGYNSDQFQTYINGIPTEYIDNGYSSYSLWSGLNDVFRNRENVNGIRAASFGYGSLGGESNIDVRASRQRKQLQVSVSFSNRSYDNRLMLTYGSGISKKGWSYAISASGRISKEGYLKGTFVRGVSYFLSVEKMFKDQSLSLTILGAPTQTAKSSAATQETYDLAGSNYYNPNWGYQNGKKRNARVENRNQPLFILTHEWKIKEKSNLLTSAGYSFGERANSGFDWYNAADPRPDYYRYLPSYYTDKDPAQSALEAQAIKDDPNLLQVNWDRLYEANRNNTLTIANVDGVPGNNVTGLRSVYIVKDEVEKVHQLNFQSVLNTSVKNSYITAGITYQFLKKNSFDRVRDLLGGDFFVDIDQFAERDFRTDPNAAQNDINHPNRILKIGDKYSFNVDIYTHKPTIWGQLVQKTKHLDIFVSSEFSNTTFWRVGHNRNGLFPNNSYGKSDVLSFFNYSVKGGLTGKINGRNYVYANAQVQTNAPYFDNVYVSFRTRDFHVDHPKSEQVYSVEAGYMLNNPRVKMRISGYYTQFRNGTDIRTYYDDQFNSFGNVSLTNINKVHYGGELGVEAYLYKGISATLVVAVGNYYYSDRMKATTYIDNTQEIFNADETIYSKGIKVAGAPQQAYTLGLNYRSPKFWYVGANVNFFDGFFTDFSPVRRTERAVDLVTYRSDQWNNILGQERYNKKGQWTLDLSGGYSWRLKSTFKKMSGKNSGKYYLYLNAGISNITNNKKFITNGYEQLRFDFKDKDPNTFANKYSYAYGITYFINLGFRM